MIRRGTMSACGTAHGGNSDRGLTPQYPKGKQNEASFFGIAAQSLVDWP
jgi:hypothetical protein